MRWKKPRFSSPSRLAAGTRTSVKKISAVSCALRPTLSRLRPRSKPAMPRSTTSSDVPYAAFASGSVLATTMTRSELMPLVMNVFWPLRTQSSPSRTAVVRIPWRSEPAPGSDIAMAVMISPEQKPGSQRCFCSSVASLSRYGATTSLWSPKPMPLACARTTSSARTALYRKSSAPPPPYSSGTLMPSRPCLPASSQTPRSTMPSASHWSWNGTTWRSRKPRTVWRNASWSSA